MTSSERMTMAVASEDSQTSSLPSHRIVLDELYLDLIHRSSENLAKDDLGVVVAIESQKGVCEFRTCASSGEVRCRITTSSGQHLCIKHYIESSRASHTSSSSGPSKPIKTIKTSKASSNAQPAEPSDSSTRSHWEGGKFVVRYTGFPCIHCSWSMSARQHTIDTTKPNTLYGRESVFYALNACGYCVVCAMSTQPHGAGLFINERNMWLDGDKQGLCRFGDPCLSPSKTLRLDHAGQCWNCWQNKWPQASLRDDGDEAPWRASIYFKQTDRHICKNASGRGKHSRWLSADLQCLACFLDAKSMEYQVPPTLSWSQSLRIELFGTKYPVTRQCDSCRNKNQESKLLNCLGRCQDCYNRIIEDFELESRRNNKQSCALSFICAFKAKDCTHCGLVKRPTNTLGHCETCWEHAVTNLQPEAIFKWTKHMESVCYAIPNRHSESDPCSQSQVNKYRCCERHFKTRLAKLEAKPRCQLCKEANVDHCNRNSYGCQNCRILGVKCIYPLDEIRTDKMTDQSDAMDVARAKENGQQRLLLDHITLPSLRQIDDQDASMSGEPKRAILEGISNWAVSKITDNLSDSKRSEFYSELPRITCVAMVRRALSRLNVEYPLDEFRLEEASVANRYWLCAAREVLLRELSTKWTLEHFCIPTDQSSPPQSKNATLLFYAFDILGYDPQEKQYFYQRVSLRRLGSIPINTEAVKQAQLLKDLGSCQDISRVASCWNRIVAFSSIRRFAAFVGTRETLRTDLAQFLGQLCKLYPIQNSDTMKPGSLLLCPGAELADNTHANIPGIWSGRDIWTTSSLGNANRSIIPSSDLDNTKTIFKVINIPGQSLEHRISRRVFALTVLMGSLEQGMQNLQDAWASATIAALSGVSPATIDMTKLSYFVCPTCSHHIPRHLQRCPVLTDDGALRCLLCHGTDQSSRGSILKGLMNHLSKEIGQSFIEVQEALGLKLDDDGRILSATNYLVPSDSIENRSRQKRANTPSVDGIYPFYENTKGNIGYHVKGNLGMIPLPANTFCRLWPKFILVAAQLARTARTEANLQLAAILCYVARDATSEYGEEKPAGKRVEMVKSWDPARRKRQRNSEMTGLRIRPTHLFSNSAIRIRRCNPVGGRPNAYDLDSSDGKKQQFNKRMDSMSMAMMKILENLRRDCTMLNDADVFANSRTDRLASLPDDLWSIADPEYKNMRLFFPFTKRGIDYTKKIRWNRETMAKYFNRLKWNMMGKCDRDATNASDPQEASKDDDTDVSVEAAAIDQATLTKFGQNEASIEEWCKNDSFASISEEDAQEYDCFMRYHGEIIKLEEMTTEVFILNIFILYLARAARLQDGTWTARCPSGLEFVPWESMPNGLSIAHKEHGRPMTCGYAIGSWNCRDCRIPSDVLAWNPDLNNIALETWAFNKARGNTPPAEQKEIVQSLTIDPSCESYKCMEDPKTILRKICLCPGAHTVGNRRATPWKCKCGKTTWAEDTGK